MQKSIQADLGVSLYGFSFACNDLMSESVDI